MKRCQPLTKAISGFSLIEITIASVLIAGIGIFMSNILVQGFKGQKNASANLDFNTKMAEVLRVIQDATQCNSVQNLIFKQASGTILNPAKLSREDSPSINTVNWIGYQVRSGSNIQNIKIIQEGDTLESTYTVSEIKFQRLKDFATGDVIAASTTGSTTTHPVELVISATPSSGAGIPINKSFKITLFTETASTSPSNNVVGCAQSSAPQITTAPQIITPNGQFPLNFTCNNANDKWSLGFWFHGVNFNSLGQIAYVRYRDFFNRYMDFNRDGSFKNSDTPSSCYGKNVSELNQTVAPP